MRILNNPEIRDAFKRHNRRAKIRRWFLSFVALVVVSVPWVQGYSRTDTLIWCFGLLMLGGFEWMRQQFKFIKLHLA